MTDSEIIEGLKTRQVVAFKALIWDYSEDLAEGCVGKPKAYTRINSIVSLREDNYISGLNRIRFNGYGI
jgi:hypothetical protein